MRSAAIRSVLRLWSIKQTHIHIHLGQSILEKKAGIFPQASAPSEFSHTSPIQHASIYVEGQKMNEELLDCT